MNNPDCHICSQAKLHELVGFQTMYRVTSDCAPWLSANYIVLAPFEARFKVDSVGCLFGYQESSSFFVSRGMNMIIITMATIGGWSLVWGLHVLWWRFAKPGKPGLVLLLLMLIASMVISISILCNLGPWAGLQCLVVSVPLTLAYVAFYSAIDADSPSLSIVLRTTCHQTEGCRKEDYMDLIATDNLLNHRIQELVNSGYVEIQNSSMVITNKGSRIASLFSVMSKVLALKKGG